jgi:hypothetical protein
MLFESSKVPDLKARWTGGVLITLEIEMLSPGVV